MGEDLLESAFNLWHDATVSAEFAGFSAEELDSVLGTNVTYFLENFDRIMRLEYKPNNEDILSVRVPTTGSLLNHG